MRTTLTAVTVALLLSALGVALGPAARAGTAARPDPTPVTWSGWRAADLGTNLRHAARRLHKPVFDSCAPLLRMEKLPHGLYISNQVRRHPAIDDVTVGPYYDGDEGPLVPAIHGPLGIHVGMRMKVLRHRIEHAGLELHNRYNTEAQHKGDYWVQRGHGHVLWFRLGLHTDGAGGVTLHQRQVDHFSLDRSKRDAFEAMTFQGGC